MSPQPAVPQLWRGDGTEQRGLVDDAPPAPDLEGAHVRVQGVSGAGAAAAIAAAAAGAASVSLVALAGDRGPAGTRHLARRLAEEAPGIRVHLDATRRVDGEVIAAYGAVPARLQHRLMLAGPHVVMLADEAGWAVLPVSPGTAACARCLDLRRADADPAWPVLAAQCEAYAPPRDPLSASLAGALAASSLAALLAGGAAPAWRVERGLPLRLVAAPHRDCGCGASGATADAL
ncbi:hypothetical protein [Demequina mangrovi]|uniref:Bacteriocin biosynthesis cyclodehydratase domain-containing protein n=1 Tax=Demequina mangrovi TaxID=1043493 RepID=A0A1H6X4L5_9MICO|nr:hypothetical protein [Demequina mangrovi]SEJ19762.1 hypothetical protein SAMN05421637_1119 [Demequina mangrovi]